MQRRDNLISSAAELRTKLESAEKDHDEARAQLARYDQDGAGAPPSPHDTAEGATLR